MWPFDEPSGPPPAGGDMVLSARHPNDQMMLRKLVAAVADGSAGGALRLRNADTEPAQHAPLADLVSPAMRLSVSPACDECQVLPGTAMVVARHLRQTPLPPASLMSELYGLTRAEAEVALRFSGAECLKRSRECGRCPLKRSDPRSRPSFAKPMLPISAISSGSLRSVPRWCPRWHKPCHRQG
jgi:hypothetical protein